MSDSESGSGKKKPYKRPAFDSDIKPRAETTAIDLQRHALKKLLADPSKPVHLPPPPREGVKTLRPPRETMKNVQGSSAGAGSGEFHVYKQSRRREYERLKLMDEEEAYNKAKEEALQRQLEYEKAAEERTAKNRLKRQRKKKGGKGGGAAKAGGAGSTEAADGSGSEGVVARYDGDKKMKVASGAGIKFKTAEEREEDDDSDEDDTEHRRQELEKEEEEKEERRLAEVAAAQEAGIFIRDED